MFERETGSCCRWALPPFGPGWKKSIAAQAALFLLASLTALLLAEFFFAGAPKVCGCFANLVASRREEAGQALMWSTARNLAMICVLAWSLWKTSTWWEGGCEKRQENKGKRRGKRLPKKT